VLRATTPPEHIIAGSNAGTVLPATGIIDPNPIVFGSVAGAVLHRSARPLPGDACEGG
jgi:hypothetical protein